MRACLALILAAILVTGCTNMRRLERGKPIRSEGSGGIMRKHLATLANPDWVAMRLQVEADVNGNNSGFKVNARMRRDSALWLSITPALGVEAARVLLTQDSVLMYSKVPGNRFAYRGDFAAIDSLLGTEINFDMVQRILLGQGIGLLDEDSKYISKVDGREHLLISKYKRRVKRLVGVKERAIAPDDSLRMEATQAVQERVMNRSDDEDLLVKSEVVGSSAAAATTAKATSKAATFTSAFFGQRKVASTPAQRLQVAQQSISERTVSLEQRAKEMREQAQAQVKAGAKQAALRSLRRSKQLEAQAQNLAKASMAVERQADMLEEAGLQQEVARALQAGVKDIKKVQTAMKTVESISDDAASMADDVDEINQLLSQLADTGADAATIDEDDLIAELDDMAQEDAAEPLPATDSAPVAPTPTPQPVPQSVPTSASFPSVPEDKPMISIALS